MSSEANPNVEVGSEGSVKGGGSNSVSFADIDDSDAPRPGAKPQSKKDDGAKAGDKPAGKDSKDAKKPAAKKEDEAPDKDDGGKESDTKDGDKRPADKPKPKKTHRGRNGDEVLAVPGDAVFKLTVNGADEEWTFQDILNEVSGKTDYNRKYQAFGRERQEHEGRVKRLNESISKIVEQSKEDPEAAYDWLCEATGQNPVEFKKNLAREQMKQAVAIIKELGYALPAEFDAELEAMIEKRGLDWDKRYIESQRKGLETSRKATESDAIVADAKKRYEIDDDSWGEAETLLRKTLEANGGKEEITPQAILYAHRHIMAARAVQDAVPDLASNPKIGEIMHDIVQTLLQSPSMTKQQLEQTLKATFGAKPEQQSNGDDSLRAVGAKIQQRQQAGAAAPSKQNQSRPILSFDDL